MIGGRAKETLSESKTSKWTVPDQDVGECPQRLCAGAASVNVSFLGRVSIPDLLLVGRSCI